VSNCFKSFTAETQRTPSWRRDFNPRLHLGLQAGARFAAYYPDVDALLLMKDDTPRCAKLCCKLSTLNYP